MGCVSGSNVPPNLRKSKFTLKEWQIPEGEIFRGLRRQPMELTHQDIWLLYWHTAREYNKDCNLQTCDILEMEKIGSGECNLALYLVKFFQSEGDHLDGVT